MEYYVQCKLKNQDVTTVAYIAEEGASVGKSMLFKDEKNSARWTVVEVYASSKALKADVLRKRSNVFDSIK
jgi:hypothetical protein